VSECICVYAHSGLCGRKSSNTEGCTWICENICVVSVWGFSQVPSWRFRVQRKRCAHELSFRAAQSLRTGTFIHGRQAR